MRHCCSIEPERADEIIKTIVDASAIGGLTYLLLKLLVLGRSRRPEPSP
jgi:hypothetical protein